MRLLELMALTRGGGELFIKRFSKRLNKNENLSIITEEEIKEVNQTM